MCSTLIYHHRQVVLFACTVLTRSSFKPHSFQASLAPIITLHTQLPANHLGNDPIEGFLLECSSKRDARRVSINVNKSSLSQPPSSFSSFSSSSSSASSSSFSPSSSSSSSSFFSSSFSHETWQVYLEHLKAFSTYDCLLSPYNDAGVTPCYLLSTPHTFSFKTPPIGEK